jgi:hypothetical protein
LTGLVLIADWVDAVRGTPGGDELATAQTVNHGAAELNGA